MLDEVATIADEAGRIAAGRCGTDYRTWEKVPGHPVCDIDLEVDAFLRDRLGKLDPEAGWLSEETLDDSDRIERRRLWVVDPIDGTRDYLRRRPGWCVSVALVEDRTPLIGVLDAPARGEHWSAEKGGGAWRNGEGSGSRPAPLAGARVAAEQLPKADGDLVAVDKPNAIALRIAMVAAGEADLLATLRWGFEWDIAAAALIAKEAGATVSGALGQPLAFNTASGEAFGVLVATPGIHAAAAARLRERPCGRRLIALFDIGRHGHAIHRIGHRFPPRSGISLAHKDMRRGTMRNGPSALIMAGLARHCWRRRRRAARRRPRPRARSRTSSIRRRPRPTCSRPRRSASPISKRG